MEDLSQSALAELIRRLGSGDQCGVAIITELWRRFGIELGASDKATITTELVRILIENPNGPEAGEILQVLANDWRRRLLPKYPDLKNDVDDIVQEAQLRLLVALERLREKGLGPTKNFLGYAFRVCANVVFDYLKGRGPERDARPIEDVIHRLVDSSPSYEDKTLRSEEETFFSERLERLFKTFEGIAGRHAREILIEYLSAEGTRGEIAQQRRDLAVRIGWSYDNLRNKIRLWRQILRQIEIE